nr:hypothetical protein [Propionicimonas sp.]
MSAAGYVIHPPGTVTTRGPAAPTLLGPSGPERTAVVQPACIEDLHLDAVVAAMAPGEFQRAVWLRPLRDPEQIRYRQEVVRDLQRTDLRAAATSFEAAVAASRNAIAARANAHYRIPADLDTLEAIRRFTAAVRDFRARLDHLRPRSAGLTGVAEWLADYERSQPFGDLAEGCAASLVEVRGPAVELGIQSGTVWAAPDGGRQPWGEQVESFFARFATPDGDASPAPARPRRYLNHVEAQAIGLVAELMPEAFERLHRFATAHAHFLPDELDHLGEELRFYLGFLKVADGLAARGVPWCLPQVREPGGGPLDLSGFVDLALALKAGPDDPLVPNDLALRPDERLVFVTGPNQGGKTTYVRAAGQLAHLASLGLPVPARAASLPVLNPVLTHFPRPDDPANQRGGLADELVRLRDLLDAADGSALLVLNELFSATTAEDALQLSGRVLGRFAEAGCRVLWVTFLEELVTATDGAVSMVGQVASDDPTRPTFRFRAQPPAGRTHAAALAARHGLSGDDLARRLR